MRSAKCGVLHPVVSREQGVRIISLLSAAFSSLVLVALGTGSAAAEIKVIEADSAYVMGDNDSKVDARRIAVQEAERKALESAGVYLESLTEVRNYQLTKDEVRGYTAGIVETEIIADEMRGTVQHPEIYIKTRCRVDTQVVLSQIERFKENEELKEQLQASAKETEDLRKERDALVKQLAGQKDKTKAEATRKKLDAVLATQEANDDINKIWTTVGAELTIAGESGKEIKQADLDKSEAVLQRAVASNPKNQQARYLLAAIYERKGDNSAAENQLQAAIRRNPSNPRLHMKLGVLWKKQGRNEAALKEFHFVERLRKNDPIMLFFTGMTLKDMNRCGKAVQYLQRFLKHQFAGRVPDKKGQAKQAIQDCGGVRGGGHLKKIRYK